MKINRKYKMLRSALFVISLLAFLWFLLPFITHGILNIGNATGMAVALSLLLYACCMAWINRLIVRSWSKCMGKVIVSIAGAVIAGIAVLTIVITGCMVTAAVNKPAEASTVIVLGCRVYGERPSLMLVERLETAYQYLVENTDSVCIVSGGQGIDEAISEAECMYRYLVDKGIDKERLYKEDKSTSTRENLAFSKKIIEEYRLNSRIAIVTNEFHEYRAGKVADALALDASAVSAKTAWWLFPTYYVRELYGILYEWIF